MAPLLVGQRHFSKRNYPTLFWEIFELTGAHRYRLQKRINLEDQKDSRERRMSIELIKVKTFNEELTELESILDRNFAAEDRI